MSVEQTFHTPSFGDEEFDIPPLTYAPTAAASRCSGQGVFGNQVPVEYLKRKLSCDQIYVYLPRQEENYPDCQLYNQHPLTHLRHPETHLQQQQQQQQGYLVQQHPNSPQNHIMSNNQFQQQQQDMYMMNQHSMGMQMQYENHPTYTNSPMQQGSMQPLQQMTLMPHQQQQQQQSHVLGPPQQQLYSPMNQSQMNSQLSPQFGMGPQQTGGSPPGSNHNSPGVESSEDSDDSTPLAQLIGAKKYQNPEPVDTVPKAAKKPKAQKKKKKRDPNEPQKPVSAYALFFRDTQAAIKGQSPNASFGEVSKIVASMWDSLDIERKNSYKKKTETAKKEYLKQLAAYRANLVSRAAVDQSDSMYGNSVNSSAPPSHSPNSSPPGRMMSMPKQPSPVLTSVVDSMQPVTNTMNMHPQNQVWHMQSPQHMNNPSPPHVMQGGNGMMGMQQQQMQQPQPMQQQPPHMSPPPQQQQMGGVMNMQQQMPGNSPQQLCNSASNSPSYNQNMSVVNSGGNHANMGNVEVMPSLPTCLRNGCSNPAIDSPDWDREYCSSECVVSHCKDVFASWVAQRQVNSNSYSTVK